jgi:Type VI secretion system (T6SS), amidase effector protein 4
MNRIPISFSKLVANYPDQVRWPTKKLLDTIGGDLRARLQDNVNTCAIRLSYALNASGIPIRHQAGVTEWAGGPVAAPGSMSHSRAPLPPKRDLFIFRVMDVKTYLTARYGPGKLIYDARKDPEHLVTPFSAVTQGIITFEWGGDPRTFGALGHADLFRVSLSGDKQPTLIPGCVGHCYFMDTTAPMLAHLWEMSP